MQTNHRFQFRWPVKQTGPNSVEMIVPRGQGPTILNPDFCEAQKLSDAEVDRAEDEVLRAIAIIG